MLFKGSREMEIITSTINAHADIEILDNFLISSTENCYDNDEVISQDRAKDMRAFLYEKYIKLMT